MNIDPRGILPPRIGALALAALASMMLTGCPGENPGPASTAYKKGELGNGGFLFACDDSVACDRWSTNDAADFPAAIATGAVFDVRFVESGEQGWTPLSSGKYHGVTEQPVEPYVGKGYDGFTSLRPGLGTIVARDSRGNIVDYVTLKIVKPDALVVYAAEYRGPRPAPIDALSLAPAERRSYRTVAEHGHEPVAGSVRVRWESADPSVVRIESYQRGVVNVLAGAAGKTKLVAVGAALTKEIEVEVKP